MYNKMVLKKVSRKEETPVKKAKIAKKRRRVFFMYNGTDKLVQIYGNG